MKKLTVLLLCLSFMFVCSCTKNETTSHPDIEVKLPDGSIANDQNTIAEVIDKENVTVEKPTEVVDYYVGSVSSKKFHLKDCTWVEKLKDENKVYFSGYNEFIENGYEPCKTCKP